MKKKSKKTILIVEDSVSLNTTLVEKLKQENFNVYSSFNGEEGLKIAHDKHPDLILLDIIMPILDGYEFMEELRKDAWGKHAKVIILTNLSMKDENVVKMVIQKDPIAFLVKSSTKLKNLIRYIHYAFEE